MCIAIRIAQFHYGNVEDKKPLNDSLLQGFGQ